MYCDKYHYITNPIATYKHTNRFKKACSHSVTWEFYSLKRLHNGGETGPVRDTSFWGTTAGRHMRHRHVGGGALLMTLPAHVNENHWRCGWRPYTHDVWGVAGVTRMQDRRSEDQRASCAGQAKPDSRLLQFREETMLSRQSLLQMNHNPLGSTALCQATSSLSVS